MNWRKWIGTGLVVVAALMMPVAMGGCGNGDEGEAPETPDLEGAMDDAQDAAEDAADEMEDAADEMAE